MPSLSAVKAANASIKFSYLPVALFVGGTSGVGQTTAEAFAQATDGNAHIMICGRNRSAAETIIATFPKPSHLDAKHEFIPCDVTSMKDVQRVTTSLRSSLPRLNFLSLSPGIMNQKGRDETEEGIDKKMALHYYGRWKFTYDLLPLLQKAKDAGEHASVMTVLGPGGKKIELDNLGLKNSFSFVKAGWTCCAYNDLMVKSFAEQNPGIAFTHVAPGAVWTGLMELPHSIRFLTPVVKGIFHPVLTSLPDCGQFMLHALLNDKGGAYRKGAKADEMGDKNYYGTEETKKAVWDHTLAEIQRAVSS